MPYVQRLNMAEGLTTQDVLQLINEFNTLRAELDDIRTKYAALLAKLDLDAGVTDTNYAATAGLAAAQFTRT